MTKLNPTIEGLFKESEAETIATLSNIMFEEYGLLGYSLDAEDVCTALINDFRFYAGWEETHQQRSGALSTINPEYVLSLGEWAIIEPVLRAHCDFIQAQRVESTASLGGERFGLTASEASQNYKEAKEQMKREAFIEEPFTFGFVE